MLLPRIAQLLVAQHGQGPGNPPPGVARHDDIINEPTRTRHERIGKLGPVFLGPLPDLVRITQGRRGK